MQLPVAVIIPTYNRAEFLKYAIESVLTQTFKEFELFIIDDGSTDNTKEVVSSFGDKRIKYIYYPKNRGPAYARNIGIKNSQSDFIAFLDSDDRWKKRKLEIQYRTMTDNPEYLLSHTDEIWYKNGKILNPKKIHKKQHGDVFRQSLRLCAISMSTVMVQRKLFKIVGLFDEKLIVCEDYDMWLRVTARFPVFLIPEHLTIKHGGHKDQLSQRFVGMDKFRIYAIEKLINSGILSRDKLKMAIEELTRKCIIYGKGCIKHNKMEEGEYYLSIPKKYKKVMCL